MSKVQLTIADNDSDSLSGALGISAERLEEIHTKLETADKTTGKPETLAEYLQRIAEITDNTEEYTFFVFQVGYAQN